MANITSNKNLNNIRTQIDLLKQRLEGIDKTLELQEEILDLLHENSKSLIKDAISHNRNSSTADEIMKSAFSKGKLPKILFKNR